jgi:hypothetical protein
LFLRSSQFARYMALIEAKTIKSYETFEPEKYTRYFVADMWYHIKINVGTVHILAKVFRPLPHTGAPVEVHSVVEGQTADSDIVFE